MKTPKCQNCGSFTRTDKTVKVNPPGSGVVYKCKKCDTQQIRVNIKVLEKMFDK